MCCVQHFSNINNVSYPLSSLSHRSCFISIIDNVIVFGNKISLSHVVTHIIFSKHMCMFLFVRRQTMISIYSLSIQMTTIAHWLFSFSFRCKLYALHSGARMFSSNRNASSLVFCFLPESLSREPCLPACVAWESLALLPLFGLACGCLSDLRTRLHGGNASHARLFFSPQKARGTIVKNQYVPIKQIYFVFLTLHACLYCKPAMSPVQRLLAAVSLRHDVEIAKSLLTSH